MKQLKTFLLTSILTIGAFSAIIITSCHKDRCAGVVCYNGGACSVGRCGCPTGYSGARCEFSSIQYDNNTFTPVYIDVNGSTSTIPAGGSVIYTGLTGSSVRVQASTYGSYGLTFNWDYNDIFPSGGNLLTEPFDVGRNFFFLAINSIVRSQIIGISVNSGLTDNVSIPGDGNTYEIGYYDNPTNAQVRLIFSNNSATTYSNLNIPYVTNAYYDLVIP
jgi:hypothetical protein